MHCHSEAKCKAVPVESCRTDAAIVLSILFLFWQQWQRQHHTLHVSSSYHWYSGCQQLPECPNNLALDSKESCQMSAIRMATFRFKIEWAAHEHLARIDSEASMKGSGNVPRATATAVPTMCLIMLNMNDEP
jgi:hypothetical protein